MRTSIRCFTLSIRVMRPHYNTKNLEIAESVEDIFREIEVIEGIKCSLSLYS
ncbi:MAG: hypothetical protein RMI56_01585 [Sulfolobales archaeon]|nr:hypothetical protein [Sulfolobales archaeon]MDW8082470.1 hypothetical protein [Sulfolobales archaeon]